MELQKIREEKKMTRKELSERTGISFRSIQDYEQGHKELANAKGSTLYKLGLALGCSIEDLIGERVQELLEKEHGRKPHHLRSTNGKVPRK